MSTLTQSRKIKLLKIEKARIELAFELKKGLITEKDIISLSQKDMEYMFKYSNKSSNYNKSVLRNILSCPFLLCDQDDLSLDIKKLLPYFLDSRYKIEQEELKYQYEEGYITKEEYEKELDELLFVFYKSSNDGKSILETGHVSNVIDNKIRKR